VNLTFTLEAVDGGRYVISLFGLADATGCLGSLIARALHCVEAEASEQRLVNTNGAHLLLVSIQRLFS